MCPILGDLQPFGMWYQSETAIDALVASVTDLRVGPSFAVADLTVLNPVDWQYISTLKTTIGSYVLRQNQPNLIGEIHDVFGRPVALTTKMPQGSALTCDTRIGALAYVRQGLEIISTQFTDYAFTNNAWVLRGELREVVVVTRPTAFCLVSGINPGWSS